MSKSAALRISAVFGAIGVALGAFGAHGLENVLTANDRVDTWETASFYHLVHAILLVVICALPTFLRSAWIMIFAGTIIFSGTLYVLSLTNVKWLGAITPLGGTLIIAGWLWLAWKGASSARSGP